MNLFAPAVRAQTNYEGVPVSEIEIAFENLSRSTIAAGQLENIVRGVVPVGSNFSAVKNREALQAIYNTKRVESARIEVYETTVNARRSVRLRFVVRRNQLVERVIINVGETTGDENITEEELLLRLNLLTTGAIVSERALAQSADQIQTYLRERGFYNAEEVRFRQEPATRETRVNIVFDVRPGAQAAVERFDVKIAGFDDAKVRDDLELKPGEFFTRQKLNEDYEKIRRELVRQNFLAAQIGDPQIAFDDETNKVTIEVAGAVGARVNVLFKRAEIETNEDGNDEILELTDEEVEVGDDTQRRLLPIKREGELSSSAIVEGERRLRNKFQEDGYFFARVRGICAVEPYAQTDSYNFRNNTPAACDFVANANTENREITVTYAVDLNRRLRLTDIRLVGTDKLTIEEVKPVLRTQQANALGIIPRLGYGRGFTSLELLDEDDRTITALMRELGYRRASVTIRQGVSPEGENLIITFVVNEGPRTFVSGVEITGNAAFADDRLQRELPELVGRPYSRARTRTGNDRILDVYSKNGYIEARSTYAIEEQPSPNQNEELVKIVYRVENEGAQTFVNRIFVLGSRNTRRESILELVPLAPGDILRADLLTEGERNLYATDAFTQITITTEPAGATADEKARRDVFVTVQEAPSKILGYGGGASTDDGAFGFVDIRHVNLLNKLYQGGARIQASRRQQLAQIDFTNPRFLSEREGGFAPLTFRAQYLRDTGVTRFFRTTLDQGAFGIVQRLDEEGNPIDEFGAETGEPSINRLTLNLETSRTFDRATRTFLFVRFRYEDVRLFNIDSLLVAPLLQPDRAVRISGFGSTFARDTRENCNNRRTLLERIRTGDEGNPCQYNASDPTRGEFLSIDYQLSTKFLGANTSFNKFSATYQRYFQFRRLNNTVLAGRAVLGAASIFQATDRDRNGTIDETDRTLPISERFFGGGSTTLRGFDFEAAGPRRAVVPQGRFRNRDGNFITLNPFLVPVGGNAIAITNLEARVPLTSYFQVVPFYDGGNVFRRASEIFRPRPSTPGDIENFNLRTLWTNTLGVGFRLRTPIGGSLAVDYGYLLNPPEFLVPQLAPAPPAVFRVRQGQLHFRFTQAF